MPPHDWIAMSATCHSYRFVDRIAPRSPASIPSERNPPAARRTRSPYCVQLIVTHSPSRLCRSATASESFRVCSKNVLTTVDPMCVPPAPLAARLLYSRPASRRAMVLPDGLEHGPVPRDHVRPTMFALDEASTCLAHRARSRWVGEQSRDPVRERPDGVPGNDEAGLLRDHRFRRPAGVAGDCRARARLRLEVDEAQAFDFQAGVARAARHLEDVTGRIVRGQLAFGHGAREDD